MSSVWFKRPTNLLPNGKFQSGRHNTCHISLLPHLGP